MESSFKKKIIPFWHAIYHFFYVKIKIDGQVTILCELAVSYTQELVYFLLSNSQKQLFLNACYFHSYYCFEFGMNDALCFINYSVQAASSGTYLKM